MKKTLLTTLVLAMVIGLASCGGGKKSKETPTTFSTCDELKDFAGYYSYADLATKWGAGTIAEPWDASGTGSQEMKVKVTWDNIKCNGRAVTIMFTNSHTGAGDAFTKSPNLYDGIFCDDYK